MTRKTGVIDGMNETQLMKELINRGVNVNGRAPLGGATALICAAREGKHHCVRLLLLHKANVNLGTIQFDTAVMVASYHGHTECVRLLLNAGADPRQTQRNNPRGNSLTYAATTMTLVAQANRAPWPILSHSHASMSN